MQGVGCGVLGDRAWNVFDIYSFRCWHDVNWELMSTERCMMFRSKVGLGLVSIYGAICGIRREYVDLRLV